MVLYLLDTHAWVEYFLGSTKGKRVEKLLKHSKSTILTAESTVCEVFSWSLREQHDFSLAMQRMKQYPFVEIMLNDWIVAAHSRHEMRLAGRKRFGMIDALSLALQKRTGAVVVTGDKHFQDLKNVIML